MKVTREDDGNSGESTVIIALSEYEASVLLAITGKIGGGGRPRDVISSLNHGLTSAGVVVDRTVKIHSSGGIILPIVP